MKKIRLRAGKPWTPNHSEISSRLECTPKPGILHGYQLASRSGCAVGGCWRDKGGDVHRDEPAWCFLSARLRRKSGAAEEGVEARVGAERSQPGICFEKSGRVGAG